MSDAKNEDDLPLLSVRQFNATWIAPHGSSAAPTRFENLARPGLRVASVPLRPRNSVRSPVTVRVGSYTSKNATRSAIPGCRVAREAGLRSAGRSRVDVHGCFGPQFAQHPLDVAGDRSRRVRPEWLRSFSAANFTGASDGHIDPQLRADAGLGVFEHAVAKTVAGHVGPVPRAAAAWATRTGRFPRHAGRRLRRWIADRVVVPGSEPEFVGVVTPGVGLAALGTTVPNAGSPAH